MVAKKKLKWTDVDDISFRLIDEFPEINPMKLSLQEISKKVTNLPEFSEDKKKPTEEALTEIQTTWFNERTDMEDELGPFVEVRDDEDGDVDEDEYRDDKMIDEKIDLLDDDEDEDEDEFNDGFHEEGEADER